LKTYLLNNPFDISEHFQRMENEFFLPGKITEFDEGTGKGKIEWQFHRYKPDWFFNKIDKHLELQNDKSAPLQDYDVHPQCDFEISFISQKTIRLRMKTSSVHYPEKDSLMLVKPVKKGKTWNTQSTKKEVVYQNKSGSVVFNKQILSIQFLNKNQELLTSTQSTHALKAMHSKAMPFSFIKNSDDYSRNVAASFSLSPDEKIFGCGESFTRLNKRGQKLVLFTTDTQSTASTQMYKPIPFFMSSRGYGMFVHTSAPLTFDFGQTHDSTSTLYSGDEELDLFFFFGTPKEILSEYTALTGRSPLPPLWSFGMWMGTISFNSEKQVKEVAMGLRKNKFPCDVIHIDSGWFEKGINCDFKFNKKTFPHPEEMMKFLKNHGFKTSLWQIPYFTPHNPLFDEIVEKQLYIKNAAGHIPTEDAILDFTNEKTIRWYSDKLKNLLRMGASVIKADFGEATPLHGLFCSGVTGFFEHNLYPLRYNKIVSEITAKETGEQIIWARSAWAGSQRYPVHWGGDAEVSDAGMAGTLRGGLSFGLSGFSFWSHDIGGFSGSPIEELYGRWAFFGLMSSHSRIHGFPPREPWKYSKPFQKSFRKIAELKYMFIPYIFTQSYLSCKNGWPLLRTLFFNYPNDSTSWFIEDEYMLGNDLLVAPLMETGRKERKVYLPEGKWINIESNKIYSGSQWHQIKSDELQGVLLLRFGAAIPYTQKIYSTTELNWSKIHWLICSDGSEEANGSLFSPGMKNEINLKFHKEKNQWQQTSRVQQNNTLTDFKTFKF